MACDQIKAILDDGGVLLDVRTPMEFSRGAIPGARNVPMNHIPALLEELPKDKPVLLYCRSGARSGAAQNYLAQAGFDAHNIGGYASYAHC